MRAPLCPSHPGGLIKASMQLCRLGFDASLADVVSRYRGRDLLTNEDSTMPHACDTVTFQDLPLQLPSFHHGQR